LQAVDPGRIARRWLATFALGTLAPLVLAPFGSSASGAHDRTDVSYAALDPRCLGASDIRSRASRRSGSTIVAACIERDARTAALHH